VTLGTLKVLILVVFIHWLFINSNWGASFHSTLMTITQFIIRCKTKVSHSIWLSFITEHTLTKGAKGPRWLQLLGELVEFKDTSSTPSTATKELLAASCLSWVTLWPRPMHKWSVVRQWWRGACITVVGVNEVAEGLGSEPVPLPFAYVPLSSTICLCTFIPSGLICFHRIEFQSELIKTRKSR
jgi:hypothetical protein